MQFQEEGGATMARKCQSCATRKGVTRFDDETFTIEHAGMTATVEGLSGWRCEPCGEVEFDAASAQRYAAAGDELMLRDRARQSASGRGKVKRNHDNFGIGLNLPALSLRTVVNPASGSACLLPPLSNPPVRQSRRPVPG
jgi:YgiT-type zinc finger domain-containing protein